MNDTEQTESSDNSTESKLSRRSERGENRSFPRKSLSDALKVVHAIKDKNAGKPFPPAEIASALGRKPRSSDFQAILASSQAYGLTDGLVKSAQVSLTNLGHKIAYPSNQHEEIENLCKSFFSVPVFKGVFEHYENNKIPEVKFFRNTLNNVFKINIDHVDEFISIFEGNMRVLNVDTQGVLKFPSQGLAETGSLQGIDRPTSLIKSGRSKVFVIMPFVERNPARSEGFFKEVFRALIEPAASSAGFDVEWANKAGSDVIQSTKINEILDADLLIADLTDHNPNVLFELGMRLAYNKGPTALIKSQDTGRLFDVDNLIRVYEYNPNLWQSSLSIDVPNLELHIRATWENRAKNETYLNILRKRIS